MRKIHLYLKAVLPPKGMTDFFFSARFTSLFKKINRRYSQTSVQFQSRGHFITRWFWNATQSPCCLKWSFFHFFHDILRWFIILYPKSLSRFEHLTYSLVFETTYRFSWTSIPYESVLVVEGAAHIKVLHTPQISHVLAPWSFNGKPICTLGHGFMFNKRRCNTNMMSLR